MLLKHLSQMTYMTSTLRKLIKPFKSLSLELKVVESPTNTTKSTSLKLVELISTKPIQHLKNIFIRASSHCNSCELSYFFLGNLWSEMLIFLSFSCKLIFFTTIFVFIKKTTPESMEGSVVICNTMFSIFDLG